MEGENQGTEASETPAANMVLCIMPGYVTPGCRGEHGAQHPALRALDSAYTFGMHFVASKGFPEILHWVFIPWQTGLAVAQPVCF